jgi:hypothetical protein
MPPTPLIMPSEKNINIQYENNENNHSSTNRENTVLIMDQK